MRTRLRLFAALLSFFLIVGIVPDSADSAAAQAQGKDVIVIDSGNQTMYQGSGSTPHTRSELATGISQPSGLAIDPTNNYLFFVNGSQTANGSAILRSNLDGTGFSLLTAGRNFASALVYDSGTNQLLFVANSANSEPTIYTIAADGSGNITAIVTGNVFQGPVDLDVDAAGGMVYYTDERGGSIRRAPIAGGSEEVLVNAETGTITGIAVDTVNDRVYWLNETDAAIKYVSIATGQTFPTSPLTAVSSSLVGQGGLQVDGSQTPAVLYFTATTGKVLSAPVDGTPTVLLDTTDSGVSVPSDLVLVDASSSSGVLTPSTSITTAPTTAVTGRTVQVTLQNFTSAIDLSGSALLRALAAAAALQIRYDVRLTAPKRKDSQQLLSKRNVVTFKNLKPGSYSVNYAVSAYRKKTKAQIKKAKAKGLTGFAAQFKKVYSTNRSPSATFAISK